MSSRIYFFRSVEGLCPDIGLERNKQLILGRGPLTTIKDSKVSRQQVVVSWNDRGIHMRQLGNNPSYINHRPLVKGEEVELNEGQVFYLVSNKFPFKLILKVDYVTGKRDSSGNMKLSEDRRDESCKTADNKPRTKQKEVTDYRGWNHGLLASMNDPELKVLEKQDHVVIKDKYPKAEHHYLVLPVERIQNLAALTDKHVCLVKSMCATARDITNQNPKHQFRLGFHAVPSMSQVHLHVISQDFNSTCLKNKKHWNSFTTDYFVNPEAVIDKLLTKGKWTSPGGAKDLLNLELKCHKCEMRPKNMPDLKKHIATHKRT